MDTSVPDVFQCDPNTLDRKQGIARLQRLVELKKQAEAKGEPLVMRLRPQDLFKTLDGLPPRLEHIRWSTLLWTIPNKVVIVYPEQGEVVLKDEPDTPNG